MPYILYTLEPTAQDNCHRHLSASRDMSAHTRGGRALCAYPSPQCVTLREALHGAPSGLARAFVQGCVGRDAALLEKFYFAFNQLLTKRTLTNFDEL